MPGKCVLMFKIKVHVKLQVYTLKFCVADLLMDLFLESLAPSGYFLRVKYEKMTAGLGVVLLLLPILVR
jgi:hypothetical protein